MNGFFCSQWPSALLIFDLLSVGCFFLFDSLALLNQELKVKFIASAIARYSSQQNKPIVRKLLSNLRKESILEILSTVLCDIQLQTLLSQYLLIQSQQQRHKTKVLNLLKVTNENNLTTSSLGKWLSVHLRTKWLQVLIPLQSLKLGIWRLFRARSSQAFRQLQNVDSL